MSGEVDVFGLLMSGPDRAVARGAAMALTGRAAAGVGSITIEEDTGGGFHSVATAAGFAAEPSRPPCGRPRTRSTAPSPGPTRARPSRSVCRTAATSPCKPQPAASACTWTRANAGARVSLQLKLRERFGWWTVARARLDRRSDARFPNRRKSRVWARVVLTRSDGWTIARREHARAACGRAVKGRRCGR